MLTVEEAIQSLVDGGIAVIGRTVHPADYELVEWVWILSIAMGRNQVLASQLHHPTMQKEMYARIHFHRSRN